jgi:protein SCO1/2
MKKTFLILCSLICFGLTACKNDTSKSKTDVAIAYQCPMQCEGDKTYAEPGSCPVCKMDLREIELEVENEVESSSGEISDMSIYNLPSTWTNQNNEEVELINFKGDVLVMVMIYTTCKAACPRLVADMRNIEERLPESTKGKVKMILVSIDPKTDTPKRLKEFAKENFMDEEPWTFLTSNEDNTREFAAVLAVNYKKISPLDFSHSNIISVFNIQGEMVFQQEGLGVNSDATIDHIEEAASQVK